jgi:hypothetical protein
MRDHEMAAMFMFAAAPAITTAPQYRQTTPLSTSEIVIVIVGCIAIMMFGAILMMLWNRYTARQAATSASPKS